ncbi:MAG: TIGR04255 family protein [Deferrisomatales bacterium]|nr:TIGR04255 family protein [Deferrisomatales bacterium]
MNLNPLTSAPPKEIPLANAPLVRVIAQVRFPLIASIERESFIAPFQEGIRRNYPVLRQEHEVGIVFGQAGVSGGPSKPVWRFHDAEGIWRVSLAPEFVALETKVYVSRSDFLSRLRTVLEAVRKHIDPQVADRLGIRYVDRIIGPDVEDFRTLVRSELAGILSTELGAHVRHALSENLFTLPDGLGSLLARWGRVPEQATVDPAVIDPLDVPSWILDLDAFVSGGLPFEPDALSKRAQRFAERIYAFFRWAVTEEFLRRYGGEV